MENINLEKLMQAQFDLAKFWLTLAISSGIGILLIDILVIFFGKLGFVFAFLAALLVVFDAVFIWQSDKLRENAEITLRKFEFFSALGWEISPRELANLLAAAPKSVKRAARSDEKYSYFASDKNKGPKKLLENLEESAWWSKHQAKRMSKYVGSVGGAMMFLAFITLIISLQSSLSQTADEIIAKVIISVIVFMFSGGYVRLAFDYNLFANQADKTEEDAFQLCSEKNVSEIQAIKLLHDYQIDRANSPLIPSWLWKMMNKELNELWNERIGLKNC
jgi:hypothetical protein